MILASDLLVYLYLSKGRNWRLGLHFPKRLLLHFCLSISITSKISRSQTTRVTARPFVSFASAKVGKIHPNFQIHTQIHTTTRRFHDQFARVQYIWSYQSRAAKEARNLTSHEYTYHRQATLCTQKSREHTAHRLYAPCLYGVGLGFT